MKPFNLLAFAALLSVAAVLVQPRPAAAEVPEIAVRHSGQLEVRWASGCTVLYSSHGVRLVAGRSCSHSQRNRSDDAAARYMREQGGGMDEGGGGSFDMRGYGKVTLGGLLTGRIFSKNGRSYALILTAPEDGLTCTGSFNKMPGSRRVMSTIIHCTNGSTGSAVLKNNLLTFSTGRKGGLVRFR